MKMVEELCELDEGLSDWEANFADDLKDRILRDRAYHKDTTFSDRQAATIEKVWDQRIGSKR